MRVAIIGAGPIGLETAVVLQEAGHEPVIYEAGRVGEHLRHWGWVELFTPWAMNTTTRGRARVPDAILADERIAPTGAELVDRYLEPLASTLDVRLQARVLSITRPGLRKGDLLGDRRRFDTPFALHLRTETGERVERADVVVDCTGVFGDPAPLGAGGGRVIGEERHPRVRYGPVPVDDLAGRSVLVVGDGASAVTVLGRLRELRPAASVRWITPRAEVPGFTSPPDDPLPARRALVALAREEAERVEHLPGASVERLDGDRVQLHDGRSFKVDAVVCCTGFRPDHRLSRELQVHLCWGTEGPMRLAAGLLAAKGGGGDCLAGGAEGPELLLNPEPGFFILGNKSYGRRSDFLLQVGYRQAEELLVLLERLG